MIGSDYPGNQRRWRNWLPLALVLLVGLVLRLALWGNLPRQGLISDEAEYLAAASWLAQGRGFTWHQGWLWTRAPLYPLFLSLHIRLFGLNLTPIFITQTILSLVNVALVYALALSNQQHSRRTATLAALLAALYFPFAAYPQMLLSETCYLTLMLAAFLTLKAWCNSHAYTPHTLLRTPFFLLTLAGGLLGLAALTRGLTLGFLPLAALWVGRVAASSTEGAGQMLRRALLAMLIFTLACSCTILPWSFYASNLYGGTVIVDTTGAFNLLLGSRTAYDGKRSDATPRNFVLAFLSTDDPQQRHELLNDSCLLKKGDPLLYEALQRPANTITQADRQRLMTAEGLCLLSAKPVAFLLKSVRELIDLFQINYTGAERMSGGFALGRLPYWYTLALFLLDDTLYLLILPLAIVGLVRQVTAGKYASPLAVLIGLWWLYNLFTAPLLFAINRFRIPLLIFACIYAAKLLERQPQHTTNHPTTTQKRLADSPRLLAALLLAASCLLTALVSYLGPYPSSRAATLIALRERPAYLQEQQLIHALGSGNTATADTILAAGHIPTRTLELALPLLAGLEGQPTAGLELLPTSQTISQTRNWRAAVVRGDLLRRMGDADGVRAAFTPTYVDQQNPVDWAWHWLSPVPTDTIDLAGNRDLGYIQGFYLGAGDPQASGTFRWSTAEARLLFPGQGNQQPQHLCLRADGRGWPHDMAMPHINLLLDDTAAKHTDVTLYTSMHLHSNTSSSTHAQPFATIALQRSVETYCVALPATQPGVDIVVLIHSPVFVPDAADLLAQQGTQAGQLRLLGVRLDWAELRAIESRQ